MKKNKLFTLLGTLAIGLSLAGCTTQEKHEATHFAEHHVTKETKKWFNHQHKTSTTQTNNIASISDGQSKSDIELAKTAFDFNKYPENVMSLGQSTITAQTAQQAEKKENGKAWYQFSGVDNLGRSGAAQALLTSQSVQTTSTMKRPQIPASSTPSGYKDNNKKVQLTNYRGFFYNKSHSIGWSLIGSAGGAAISSNPIMSKPNLTTGTRAQNVGTNGRGHKGPGGMAYGETLIRNYLKNHNGQSVYYTVTPVYLNNELVPRGSHVQAYSVNDNGKAINLNLWVFNTQDGANINYQTGQFTLNK